MVTIINTWLRLGNNHGEALKKKKKTLTVGWKREMNSSLSCLSLMFC